MKPYFGEAKIVHDGVILTCRYIAPNLTLHDLVMIFERAKEKSKPEDEFAADPSKWPDVRGVQAVADAVILAIARANVTAKNS